MIHHCKHNYIANIFPHETVSLKHTNFEAQIFSKSDSTLMYYVIYPYVHGCIYIYFTSAYTEMQVLTVFLDIKVFILIEQNKSLK